MEAAAEVISEEQLKTEIGHFKAHLLSVCSALGGQVGGEYVPGDEVVDCLKDLKRYLKDEDGQEPRVVFSCLAEWKVTQDHFIPLMMLEGENVNPKIFGAVIEILVPLTWPLEDAKIAQYHQQILNFKAAFASSKGIFHRIMRQAMAVLAVSPRSRSERQEANLRLLLLLVRNIVCIRDGASGINMTTETVLRSNLQERIVERMHNEQMLEMLMAFTGSMDQGSGFTDWNVIILEIVHYILGDRDPAQILNGPQYSAGNAAEKSVSTGSSKSTASTFTRHPRFGGCLALVGADGKRMVAHNSVPNLERVLGTVDSSKKQKQVKIRPEYRKTVYKPFVSVNGCKAFRALALGILENGFNGKFS